MLFGQFIRIVMLKYTLFFFMFLSLNTFAQEKNSEPKLIIYGSEQCYHCLITQKKLIEWGVEFRFFDVDQTETTLRQMLRILTENNISLKNLHLPVIVIDNTVFTNQPDFEIFLAELYNKTITFQKKEELKN
jgi:glutaredoxin 3